MGPVSAFSFFPDADSLDAIYSDAISFLDSDDWRSFASSVTNTSRPSSPHRLDVLVKRVHSGVISAHSVFSASSTDDLLEQMSSSFSLPLFRLAVQLNAKRSLPAKLFLEKLIQACPDRVIQAVRDLSLSPNLLSPLITSLLLAYSRHQYAPLRDFFLTLPIAPVIEQIRLVDADFVDLLLSMSRCRDFCRTVSAEISKAIDDCNGRFVNAVLDVLERKLSTPGFNYSDAFSAIFRNSPKPFLMQVLNARAAETEESILQMQNVLLDTSLCHRKSLSEEQLIRFAAEYQRKRVFPQALATLFMFERKSIISTLRELARTNSIVQFMLGELEREGKFPRPVSSHSNWEQVVRQIRINDNSLDAVVDVLEQSKVSCDSFGSELIGCFHIALFKRHSKNIAGFADLFQEKVVGKMSFSMQDQFADLVVSFLCAKLIDQHRRSLSILALRCPIEKFVGRFTEAPSSRELEILIGLHRAAILSGKFLKLKANLTVKSDSTIVIDRIIVLRLRWRVLRQDSLDGTCWLPEFLQLCESDPVLFLRWEMTQNSDELAKLGILGNFSLLPQLLHEFLLCPVEPSKGLLATLVSLFARIPCDQVRLPERPNMELLFQLEELWCSQILNHWKVVQVLRNPS